MSEREYVGRGDEWNMHSLIREHCKATQPTVVGDRVDVVCVERGVYDFYLVRSGG